jgi:hypothetical protein
MVDQIYDRQYQAGRAELHAGIDRLGRKIIEGFRTLNRIQFEAPWKRSQRTRTC